MLRLTRLIYVLLAVCTAAAPATRPSYTVGGTVGSYGDNSHTAASALAGGYFDAPVPTGASIEVDYAQPVGMPSVTFAPRPGWAGRRLTGGVFQAKNAGDAAWTTLYTIGTPAPVASVTVPLPTTAAYSSYRYVGPPDSYCNISGLSFNAVAAVTPTTAPVQQPPVVVAPIVVPPQLPPVVLPPAPKLVALKVGVGPRQTTAAGSTAGMAPAVAWGDLRGVADVTADAISWDFGDGANAQSYPDPRHAVDPAHYPAATYSPNTGLCGAVEGYVYEQPGTYAIRATVRHPDGSVVVATNTVVVTADAREHRTFVTGDDAAYRAFLNNRPNVWATIRAANQITLTDTLQVANGSLAEGEQDAGGRLSLVTGGNGSTFATLDNATGIVIRRLHAEGATKPFVLPGADPVTFASSSNVFLTNRASAVALYDCQFGTLGALFKGYATGPAGVLIARNASLDRTATSAKGVVLHGMGVSEQVIAEWSGGLESWQGNTVLGSVWQSPTRTDSVGSGEGISYEFNDVRNSDFEKKANLTFRNASDAYVGHNLFRDGLVATSTTIGSTATRITRVRHDDNFGIGQAFQVGPRSDHIAITNNRLTKAGTGAGSGYGIQMSTDAAAGVHDVTLTGNVGESAVAKVFGSPFRVVADCAVDNNGTMTVKPTPATATTQPVSVAPAAANPLALAGNLLTLDGVPVATLSPRADGLTVGYSAVVDGPELRLAMLLTNSGSAAVTNPIVKLLDYRFAGQPDGTLAHDNFGNLAAWGPSRWYASGLSHPVGVSTASDGATALAAYLTSEGERPSLLFGGWADGDRMAPSGALNVWLSDGVPAGGTRAVGAVVRWTR